MYIKSSRQQMRQTKSKIDVETDNETMSVLSPIPTLNYFIFSTLSTLI